MLFLEGISKAECFPTSDTAVTLGYTAPDGRCSPNVHEIWHHLTPVTELSYESWEEGISDKVQRAQIEY